MDNDRHPYSHNHFWIELLILGYLDEDFDEEIYYDKKWMLDHGYISYNSTYVKLNEMTDTELYRAIDEKKNQCNSCEHKKDKKTKANKGIIIAIIIFAVLLLGVGIWLLVGQSLVVEGVVIVIIAGIFSLPFIISIAKLRKRKLQMEENLYEQEKLKLETELQRREILKAQNRMSNKDDIEVKTQQIFWPKSMDLKWCGYNPYVKNLIKELKNKEKEEGQN